MTYRPTPPTDQEAFDRVHARYLCVLTLYGLYRLRDEAPVIPTTLRQELTELIAKLEARLFPECFSPDLAKTVASARWIISQHDARQ